MGITELGDKLRLYLACFEQLFAFKMFCAVLHCVDEGEY